MSETGQVQNLSEVEAGEEPRYSTGMAEFDRVLGGGLVHGGRRIAGGTRASVNRRCYCKRYVICLHSADAMYCM